jgi:broad specificity phosphatase PhoE
MRRGIETANVIAEVHGLSASVDDALLERMEWVPSSGISLAEFLAEWERASRDRDRVPPVGASSRATGARMAAALARVGKGRAEGTVVCVTHGGATVDLLRDLMGDEALECAARGIIANGFPGGALTTILVTPTELRPVRIAEVDHIGLADRTGHVVDPS